MQKLPTAKYETVRKFFSRNYPNLPEIYSVIEQITPGEVWVDHVDNPTFCLVMTNNIYRFISGVIDEETFKPYIEILQRQSLVKLAIEPQPQFDLAPLGFKTVPRRQYRYRDNQKDIPLFKNTTPYEILKIDSVEMINLCLWKELVLGMYGSYENYFKNAFSFILWDPLKKMIASECHGLPSKELVEVGTITHENYRKQNLSTILCNHLIHYALERNLQPVWSCDDANFISWKVAEKQGMDDMLRYTFYVREVS